MSDPMCGRADWDGIENDVIRCIRILRGLCQNLPDNETNRLIVRDLVIPNLRLLGQLCENIKITETADGKFVDDLAPHSESALPAHCVHCGYVTRKLPRPNNCPICGRLSPWGSPSAPFPTPQ